MQTTGLIVLAVLLLIAGGAWLLKRRAQRPASPAGSMAGDTGPAVAPAVDPASPAGALGVDAAGLESALASATSQLWQSVLGARAGASAMPAGHERIVSDARQALAAETLADRHFPRRPMLMPQLQAAVNDQNSAPTRLADIIAQDPVLAGNVLRLANSVFFRLSAQPVDSIQRAVVVCGTDGLQSLAATALVQPVFRAGKDSHSRFPAALWERCTRASVAAEMLARQWCPADRAAAQLLPLLAALGPLVAYRVVQDQYRADPQLPPEPAVFLGVILRFGQPLAARVAAMWQSAPRIVSVLSGATPEYPAAAQAQEPLAHAFRAGELLGTLSVLAGEGLWSQQQCHDVALQTGLTESLYKTVWARLHPPVADAAASA